MAKRITSTQLEDRLAGLDPDTRAVWEQLNRLVAHTKCHRLEVADQDLCGATRVTTRGLADAIVTLGGRGLVEIYDSEKSGSHTIYVLSDLRDEGARA